MSCSEKFLDEAVSIKIFLAYLVTHKIRFQYAQNTPTSISIAMREYSQTSQLQVIGKLCFVAEIGEIENVVKKRDDRWKGIGRYGKVSLPSYFGPGLPLDCKR